MSRNSACNKSRVWALLLPRRCKSWRLPVFGSMYVTRAHHVAFAPFRRGLRLTIEPVLAFMLPAPLVQNSRLLMRENVHTHSHTIPLILADGSSDLWRDLTARSVNEHRQIVQFVIHGDNSSKRPQTDS